jgi:hypothetical protein
LALPFATTAASHLCVTVADDALAIIATSECKVKQLDLKGLDLARISITTFNAFFANQSLAVMFLR